MCSYTTFQGRGDGVLLGSGPRQDPAQPYMNCGGPFLTTTNAPHNKIPVMVTPYRDVTGELLLIFCGFS